MAPFTWPAQSCPSVIFPSVSPRENSSGSVGPDPMGNRIREPESQTASGQRCS